MIITILGTKKKKGKIWKASSEKKKKTFFLQRIIHVNLLGQCGHGKNFLQVLKGL